MPTQNMGYTAIFYILCKQCGGAQTSGQQPLSEIMLEQQLLLFGKVARAPVDSVLKLSVFQPSPPGRFWFASDRYARKKGRARIEWAAQVLPKAIAAAGTEQLLHESVQIPAIWKSLVRRKVRP